MEEATHILQRTPFLFQHSPIGRTGWTNARSSCPAGVRQILHRCIGGTSRHISIPGLTTGLQKISTGLDEAQPFDDFLAVEFILQEEEKMMSSPVEAVSPRNAGRIWAFISKFVMVDRLSQVFGAADVHPGLPVPRKTCSADYLRTGGKVIYLSRGTFIF